MFSFVATQKFSAELSPLLPLPPPSSDDSEPDPFSHLYFNSPSSRTILDKVIAMHFIREGRGQVGRKFVEVRPLGRSRTPGRACGFR
jgi:hypothetical protein